MVDAFVGVGGNAIAIATDGGHRIIAFDVDENRLAIAKHNAEVYGVAERIEVDWLSLLSPPCPA